MKAAKVKEKKKVKKFVPLYNSRGIENQPTEVDCPQCKRTGWIGEAKCDNCDGYGFLSVTPTQRMHLAFGDCYINKEKGCVTYYV